MSKVKAKQKANQKDLTDISTDIAILTTAYTASGQILKNANESENKHQKFPVNYVDRYRALAKRIGDALTDFRDKDCGWDKIAEWGENDDSLTEFRECYGWPEIVESREIDWLNFHFYPTLQLNNVAKDIQEKVEKAHTVLAKLTYAGGYEEYYGKIIIEVDLNAFNKSPSKKLLENLIRSPAGVENDEKLFGKRPPDQLKKEDLKISV